MAAVIAQWHSVLLGRLKRALQAQEAARLLDTWRPEQVMLRWSDIRAEAGSVAGRHGKGGQEREAAILDRSRGMDQALERLRQSQPEGYHYQTALRATL